jgi:hypothetical protein
MPEDVQRELRAKLLACGGERAAFYGPEPHAKDLLERGRLFDEPVKMRPSKARQCHTNVSRIWERAPTKNRIVTGYGLSNGVWMSHTWALRDGAVLETTVARERYFGVELEDEAALAFWLGNLHTHRYPGDAQPPERYWLRRRPIMRLLAASLRRKGYLVVLPPEYGESLEDALLPAREYLQRNGFELQVPGGKIVGVKEVSRKPRKGARKEAGTGPSAPG